MAALVGGTVVVATWAAWHFTPVDAPPTGQETSEWLHDLAEDDRLMQEAASKYVKLFLAEAMGLVAWAMQLQDELRAYSAELSSRTYALPLLRRPLQIQASSDPGDGDYDFFGMRALRLDEQKRKKLLQEMEDAGWGRAQAEASLAAFSQITGHEDDYPGDFLLQTFFRKLRDAGFSVSDQQQLLDQVAMQYPLTFETFLLIQKINDIREVLLQFPQWTPEWQTLLLLTVMRGVGGQALEALDVVYQACIHTSPEPASWPPLEFIATLEEVRQAFGALNSTIPAGHIHAHRVTVH
jgi:hypothetical protein